MRDGTARCHALAAALSDQDAIGPSRLPGWRRAHLLTHLARNADALVNLLDWARTGVPTPMYASAEQREADIQAGAARPAAQLREDLTTASNRLAAAVDAMHPADWRVLVRTAQGRELPAGRVPWLRTREVWVHAVDLDAGMAMADLPSELVDALLDDVTGAFTRRRGTPALRLAPTDRDREWTVGTGASVTMAGPSPELLGWLIGRNGPDRLAVTGADQPPTLPPWL